MYSASKSGVIICGAGIGGVSAAYYLAKSGIRDILLVDDRPPLTLTSDRSTECYRNWWPDPAILALMNRSIDLMEELADESNNCFHLNRRGYLYVTADSKGSARLAQSAHRISEMGGGAFRIHEDGSASYARHHSDGFHDEPDGADLLLGTKVIRDHFPYLSPRAVAALHVRKAGWLSAQQLGMHLLDRARLMGVKVVTAHLDAVETTSDKVSAVRLRTGDRLPCSTFVDAAGPFLKSVAAMLGVAVPVSTEVHLKAVFKDPQGIVRRDAPLLIWDDPQFLPWTDEERDLLKTDGESIWLTEVLPAGAHTRPEGPGDSQSILMLWDYRSRLIDPAFPIPLDEQYPEIALRGLSTMLPGLETYIGRAARPYVDGGYYVKTPENRLLVGPLPVAGAYILGALSGYGIMSACAAGELLAAHINGAPLPSYASAFSLQRYDDPAYQETLSELTDTGQL